MSLFSRWKPTVDPEGLERAKRAEAAADESLRKAKATSTWARNALARDGFAEQLVHIIQGGPS